MSKKVVVIKTSLRLNSNSDILADYFINGAKDSGNDVEVISLKDKTIGFCKGCLACQKTQVCTIKDDAIEIAKSVLNADVVVFASPVYYYGIAGQMKTLLDRLNPLFTMDYKFRAIYFLATAAEDDMEAFVGPEKGLNGWIECYSKAYLAGTVYSKGVTDALDIKGHNELDKAYHMGYIYNQY